MLAEFLSEAEKMRGKSVQIRRGQAMMNLLLMKNEILYRQIVETPADIFYIPDDCLDSSVEFQTFKQFLADNLVVANAS